MEPATQKIFSRKKSRMQWHAWLVFTAAFFTVSSCARFNDDIALSRYEFNKPEMGLPFRIVLYAKSDEQARTSAFAAFARIEQLNGILSDYDPDSELSKLSRTSGSGQAMKVSGDLWSVLKQSQELAERSRGAFDATVGPAVNLWRIARREKKMPDKDELAKAKAAMGWENLRLNSRNHTVELLVPNMRLDLGGIAKGYAVDEAMKILRQHGIRSALIAGGGDMAVGDAPPGKSGWTVEIAPIDSPNAPPKRFVQLKNRGLATSGDVFQRLEIDGQRYSHIVDPRTGIGLTDHSLVTIIADNCTTADSLATAVSVLGPGKGLELIEKTRHAEAHILRKPGERIESFESRGFKDFYK